MGNSVGWCQGSRQGDAGSASVVGLPLGNEDLWEPPYEFAKHRFWLEVERPSYHHELDHRNVALSGLDPRHEVWRLRQTAGQVPLTKPFRLSLRYQQGDQGIVGWR